MTNKRIIFTFELDFGEWPEDEIPDHLVGRFPGKPSDWQEQWEEYWTQSDYFMEKMKMVDVRAENVK